MDFGQLLSAYGLPGIIIFALGMVVVYQQRLIIKLYDRLFETQEARRQEGLEVSKELNQTLQQFSQSTKMLVDKIQVARGEREP
jgi:hypothetical protein